MDAGYTRVPVHYPGDAAALVGYMLVKDLIMLRPDDRTKLASLKVGQPKCVSSRCKRRGRWEGCAAIECA